MNPLVDNIDSVLITATKECLITITNHEIPRESDLICLHSKTKTPTKPNMNNKSFIEYMLSPNLFQISKNENN